MGRLFGTVQTAFPDRPGRAFLLELYKGNMFFL